MLFRADMYDPFIICSLKQNIWMDHAWPSCQFRCNNSIFITELPQLNSNCWRHLKKENRRRNNSNSTITWTKQDKEHISWRSKTTHTEIRWDRVLRLATSCGIRRKILWPSSMLYIPLEHKLRYEQLSSNEEVINWTGHGWWTKTPQSGILECWCLSRLSNRLCFLLLSARYGYPIKK